MSDHTNHNTYVRDSVREVPATTSSSSGSTAFILGALAVAVLVIVWAVLSGGDAPSTAPVTGDNNVSVEAPAAPDAAAPEASAPVQTAPEAAPETAPAAPEAAPAEPAAPADGAATTEPSN